MFTHQQAVRAAEALRRASEYPVNPKPREPPPPPYTIALSREAGSGSSQVACEVGRRLNWPVYDHEILTHLAEDLRVDEHRLMGIDERPGSRLVECLEAFAASSTLTEVSYFRSLLKLILALGARGACIIVGRGAVFALPPATTLRVRVMAAQPDRLAAVMRENDLTRSQAARYLETRDHERCRFIKDHFHKDVYDPLHYDVLLNASRFTLEECASIVIESLARLQARKIPASKPV